MPRFECVKYCAAAALLVQIVFAIPTYAQPKEGIDLWRVGAGAIAYLNSDSIWIGATFLRDTTKPLITTCISGSGAWDGYLELMIPGGKSNGQDTAIYLFDKNDIGKRLDLTYNSLVRQYIHHKDTLYFLFVAHEYGDSLAVHSMHYTGPNRRAGDPLPWIQTDRYTSPVYLNGLITMYSGVQVPIGRRRMMAGWLWDNNMRVPTDTVVWGIEDLDDNNGVRFEGANTYGNWQDHIFHLYGVFLNSPSTPTTLTLLVADSSITAGTWVTIKGYIYDQNDSLRSDLAQQIRWQVLPTYPKQAGDSLTRAQGDSTRFRALRAYRNIPIQAWYHDASGRDLYDTAWVYIEPGPPSHLVIESDPNRSTSNQWYDNPLPSLTISTGQTTRTDLYAILRDQYGNWVSPSQQTGWDTVYAATRIVSATNGTNTNLGQGSVSKVLDNGTQNIRAWSANSAYTGALFRDTLPVTVDPASYTQLRIVNSARQQIALLIISIDNDTTLIVQGYRPDFTRWEDVTGSWSMSAAIKSDSAPPGNKSSFYFSPTDTGRGAISVSRGAGAGALSTSINVTVLPGAPAHIVLYSYTGKPHSPDDPYPLVLFPNRKAGDTVDLVAKVFDKNWVWLRDYEENATYSSRIGWELSPAGGIGSLTASSGHQSNFIPITAGQQAYVITSLPQGATTLLDTLIVNIIPGDPASIQVVRDTTSRPPSPITGTVIFPTADSVQFVYSVVYDRFGNYIGWAQGAQYVSNIPAQIYARAGTNFTYGEGRISRLTDQEATAQIVAEYSPRPGAYLRDTITVQISSVTYDSLAIYVLSGGKQYITSLTIHTDEDTVLYAEAHRADGRGWDNYAVQWSKTAGLVIAGTPPQAVLWTIAPTAIGTGRIKITGLGVAAGAKADSISVTVLPGLPNRIAVYPDTVSATAAYSPSQALNITAGHAAELYARVFDRNGVRLYQFENADSSRAIMTWRAAIVPDNIGVDSLLSTVQTYHSRFTPQRAYTTYRATLTYTKSGTTLTGSALFYVGPDTAYRMVIEEDPQYDNNTPMPYDVMEFSGNDRIKYAYAILRDRFGNFAGFSTQTDWTTRDATIATGAEGGLAAKGEGEVTRVGTTGEAQMVARNRAKPFLMDSVLVRLTNVIYDRLRIVVNDTLPINALAMQTDQDTVLMVQALRHHDSAWVSVPATWIFIPANLSQNPGQGTNQITFSPTDTAHGKVIVNYGSAIPDTLPVTVTVGPPTRIALYPKEGPPAGYAGADPANVAYDSVELAIAGTAFPLVADAFYKNIWLADYQLTPAKYGEIKWQLIDPDTVGSLSATSGYKVSFLPRRAHHRATVIVKLFSGALNDTLRDTIVLDVKPGRPYRLVLEGDAQASLNQADPIDTVQISDNTFNGYAYAIVRDSLFNYIGYANPAAWGVVATQPQIVTVTAGQAQLGEGKITKDTSAAENVTQIYAVYQTTYLGRDITLRDTTYVKLLRYHYTALKIEPKDTKTANAISKDTLHLPTTESAALVVKGLRSDCNDANNPSCWELVPARWEASSTLQFETPPPGSASGWTFSPSDTGRGLIRVVLDNDPHATPDTLHAVFMPGPPSTISMTILTPVEERRAGDTISVLVSISNNDGLVPGPWCDTVYYQDILGNGGRDSVPRVIVDGNGDTLRSVPDSSGKVRECFNGGLDTVKFVLYYAPDDWITQRTDSMHQFIATLDNIKGQTDRFYLYPGDLKKIVLDPRISSRMDSITLRYPAGDEWIDAKGYDVFGNYMGLISSNWDVTGSLHAPDNERNQKSIHYTSANVTTSEEGWMIARAGSDSTITDSIFVRIIGPLTLIDTALTQDVNGNGLLDRIVVHFDKPVFLPDDYSTDSITISYYVPTAGTTVTFRVKSISALGDTTDSVVVELYEDSSTNLPQTAWTPDIVFKGIENMTQAPTVCVDGAGPVIWSVTKTVTNVSDRKEDLVHVEFSEPIKDAAGAAFLSNTSSPQALFVVWLPRADNPDSLVPVTDMLDSIRAFYKTDASGQWVEFYMSNGENLTINHRLSIAVDTSDHSSPSDLRDRSANYPEPVNVPVKVRVVGKIVETATVGPNPVPPTAAHSDYVFAQDWKAFDTDDPQLATKWAYNDGGSVIYVDWVIPSLGTVFGKDTLKSYDQLRIEGSLKFYDIIGNLVYHQDNADDILPPLLRQQMRQRAGSNFRISFYWNCLNDRRMKVLPGVYRGVLMLKIHPSNEIHSYLATVGVRK